MENNSFSLPPSSTSLTRRSFFGGLFATSSLLATLGVGLHTAHDVQVVYRDFLLPPTTPGDGIQLIFLSDLHRHQNHLLTTDPTISVGQIKKTITEALEKVATTGQEVVVVITGDIATCAKAIFGRAESDQAYVQHCLNTLTVGADRVPMYRVPGNHDTQLTRYPELIQMMEQAGMRKLTDVEDIPLHGGVRVMGSPDYLTEKEKYTKRTLSAYSYYLADEIATVFLTHNPEAFHQILRGSVRQSLLLAGHTHGNQFRGIPLFGDFYLRNILGYHGRFVSGRYPLGETSEAYISPGIGTTQDLPVRYGAPPEIIVYNLHHAC